MADAEQLRMAVKRLETAANDISDQEDAARLAEFADQLSGLLAEGRTPDHGRLARILHVLDEIEAETDPAASVDQAREALIAYREGVEGV